MSQAHHPDAVEANLETHPVKLAIWIVLGAISLIVGIILLVQFAIGAYGSRSLEGDPAMTAAALEKRIGPVAKLQLESEAPAAPAAAPAAKPGAAPASKPGAAPAAGAAKVATVMPAPANPAAAAKPDGKKVYDSICMACHATGAAGAPKRGDKAAWAPRIATGTAALYASALKGKGAMPAKGGNPALADADVKAAVDYIVAGSK